MPIRFAKRIAVRATGLSLPVSQINGLHPSFIETCSICNEYAAMPRGPNMHVTLPFVYQITHQKPGKPKATTSAAFDMVSADIPEVGRSDVSLAAKWDRTLNGGLVTDCVITLNGDLFMKSGISRDDLEGRHNGRLNGENMRLIYGMPYYGSVEGKLLLKALSGEQPPRGLPKSADITSTTLQHDQVEAQNMIDGLLIVEGEVWHRIPALVLHFHQFRPTDACELSIAPPPYGHGKAGILSGMVGIQSPVFTRFFSINEIDQALTHAGDNEVVRHFLNLEVHQPDLLAFDGRSEFAARIMNSAVRTNEYRAGEMGDPEITLWMRMRDVVAGWYGIPSIPITDEDVAALYEFCAMTPKSHMNEWPRRGCEILDVYRADLKRPPAAKAPSPRR
ncbi:hypothetical protein OIU34_20480 [Pararhizobium sp. BT-229]|uniref:hypothetical protein n=1 Tax=Pararhizobium sp. BT-229 TaxID=2986923 RepID=UPI0021F6D870|nr:hypothetical protein [Pararhizobium sp. BT-229]MCV9964266.1 hypothetical protein [Pararhizobium sp. BT-229]